MNASEEAVRVAIKAKLASAPHTLPELRITIARDLADDNRLADTGGEPIGTLVERSTEQLCRDGTIALRDGAYVLTGNPGRPSWSA